jgi:hypothetical protein
MNHNWRIFKSLWSLVMNAQELRAKIAAEIEAELICCTPDMECHERHDMCKYATFARDIVLGS